MEQNGKPVSPMSNEGRNAYVVERLTAALLELLREKPLADISVSELCGRARTARPYGAVSVFIRRGGPVWPPAGPQAGS